MIYFVEICARFCKISSMNRLEKLIISILICIFGGGHIVRPDDGKGQWYSNFR